MWRTKKRGKDGERIMSEPIAVATKLNTFFATIEYRIAKKLCCCSVSRIAYKKYESVIQTDDENL